jgi:hypothetical protein
MGRRRIGIDSLVWAAVKLTPCLPVRRRKLRHHTYVLGGWLITPDHYSIMGDLWGGMLGTLKLADGSPRPGLHAQEIMSQSGIYEGWGKDEAFHAFDQATAVFTDRPGRFAASPCAVATKIRTTLARADRDEIWKIVFMRFFVLVLECSPGGKSIDFVLDRKPEIGKYADAAYEMVASAYATVLPDTFHKDMPFVDDEKAAQIQAADLPLFGWRKTD